MPIRTTINTTSKTLVISSFVEAPGHPNKWYIFCWKIVPDFYRREFFAKHPHKETTVGYYFGSDMIFEYNPFVFRIGNIEDYRKFQNCISVNNKKFNDAKMAEQLVKQIIIDYNFDIQY